MDDYAARRGTSNSGARSESSRGGPTSYGELTQRWRNYQYHIHQLTTTRQKMPANSGQQESSVASLQVQRVIRELIAAGLRVSQLGAVARYESRYDVV